ncbi:MAG TPA: AAA family ATPase [Candidatus Babeliales bacterium]|nr:AAA family ATPase [Candidatus Babeliales bacterium]
MTNQPKRMGIHYSIFENFVKENRIYVDKTKHIYNLITAPEYNHFYFVSRPRRFGKSLFISTLKAIFLGKKELFNEYWIGKNGNYEWQTHPIIHLDFGGIVHKLPEQFEQNFCLALRSIAKQYGADELEGTNPGRLLQDLVQKIAIHGKIVLLIDEYDKPIVDHIDNLQIAEENRKILGSFYTTVKSLEADWRAIFITGVSKFSKTSLFSGLNNLTELSLDPIAAELFGYTEQELITYYSPQIDALAHHIGKTREVVLTDLKNWYDGYRFCDDFTKPQMYNPLSVTTCLANKKFANYWFNTGSPGFLIALLRKKGISLELNEPIEMPMSGLESIDINNIPLYTLLLQTGYLTIVDYDPSVEAFTLNYPNQEVRKSFKDYLVQAFAYTTPDVLQMELVRMRRALLEQNFETFCRAIKILFAGIPYNLHIPRESYYHSLIHLMFDLLGMKPQSEVASSSGRSDLVLETANTIFIFEFKYDGSAQQALDQIIQKKYYEKYMHSNKAITLVGINMNFKDKNVEFEWVQQNVQKIKN